MFCKLNETEYYVCGRLQIESSFRQMLTAYRTVLITQFNEWDVSVVTNIEQPNTVRLYFY